MIDAGRHQEAFDLYYRHVASLSVRFSVVEPEQQDPEAILSVVPGRPGSGAHINPMI